MVDGVDKERYELAEVNICIPGCFQEFRSSVDKVCCEDLVDDAFFVSLVEVVDALCEECERYCAEYLAGTAVLHCFCDIDHGITG